MEKRNVYLPKQQDELLIGLSKETGMSVSEHIRRALDIYLYIEHEDRMEALAKVGGRWKHTTKETEDYYNK